MIYLKTKEKNLTIGSKISEGKTVSMSLSDYYKQTRGMTLSFIDEANNQLQEQEKVKSKIKE